MSVPGWGASICDTLSRSFLFLASVILDPHIRLRFSSKLPCIALLWCGRSINSTSTYTRKLIDCSLVIHPVRCISVSTCRFFRYLLKDIQGALLLGGPAESPPNPPRQSQEAPVRSRSGCPAQRYGTGGFHLERLWRFGWLMMG